MSTKNPWMKFYPQDWRADERLRMCSLSARGLWIEMIAIMHRSDQYGQLIINGIAPTDMQLAVQVGTSPEQIPELIGELESAGVFSRTRKGVIYSRRMNRDNKKSQVAQKNGSLGGNPTLGKTKDNFGQLNLDDNLDDKPKKLEARNKKDKRDTNVSPKNKTVKGTKVPDDFVPVLTEVTQRIVDGWPPGRLANVIEAFKGYHQNKGTLGKDWQAGFRTWVVNDEKFSSNSTNGNSAKAEPSDAMLRASLRFNERFAASRTEGGEVLQLPYSGSRPN